MNKQRNIINSKGYLFSDLVKEYQKRYPYPRIVSESAATHMNFTYVFSSLLWYADKYLEETGLIKDVCNGYLRVHFYALKRVLRFCCVLNGKKMYSFNKNVLALPYRDWDISAGNLEKRIVKHFCFAVLRYSLSDDLLEEV